MTRSMKAVPSWLTCSGRWSSEPRRLPHDPPFYRSVQTPGRDRASCLNRAIEPQARGTAREPPGVPPGQDAWPDLRETLAPDASQLRGGDRPSGRQRDLPPRQGRRDRRPRECRRLRASPQPVCRRPGRPDVLAHPDRGAGAARHDPDRQRPVRHRPPLPGAGRPDDHSGVTGRAQRGQARLRRRR